jgi:hypothetical protein
MCNKKKARRNTRKWVQKYKHVGANIGEKAVYMRSLLLDDVITVSLSVV